VTSPNQIYYGTVGLGEWRGTFVFEIRSWNKLWKARIGFKNLVLVLALLFVQRLFGPARIRSEIRQESALLFNNVYRLRKLAITLCEFRDMYRLDENGTGVEVRTDLRYGPIPGILESRVDYVATISHGGLVSRYDGLVLLGSKWTGRYWVHPDHDRVCGVLTCAWAEAFEYMTRN
jgi:hypothetical protein